MNDLVEEEIKAGISPERVVRFFFIRLVFESRFSLLFRSSADFPCESTVVSLSRPHLSIRTGAVLWLFMLVRWERSLLVRFHVRFVSLSFDVSAHARRCHCSVNVVTVVNDIS